MSLFFVPTCPVNVSRETFEDYKKGDVVIFQNKMWYAVADNTNYEPNLNHYPWVIISMPKMPAKTPQGICFTFVACFVFPNFFLPFIHIPPFYFLTMSTNRFLRF